MDGAPTTSFREAFGNARVLFRECVAPRRALLLKTLVVVVLFNAFDLLFPKALSLYLDTVAGKAAAVLGWRLPLPEDAFRVGLVFGAGLVVLGLIRWGVIYLRSVLETRLGQSALFDLRHRIFDTMQNLSFAYHDRTHSGTLIANVVEDVGQANMFLSRGFFPLLEAAAYLSVAYGLMAWTCWPAALASLGLLSVAFLCTALYYTYGFPYFQTARTALAETVSDFSESMEGQQLIRAYGRHEERIGHYVGLVRRFHDAQWTEMRLTAFNSQSYQWPATLGVAAILAGAIWSLRLGWSLGTGDLFLLFYLQQRILTNARMASRALDHFMRFSTAAARLGQLFQAEDYLADPRDDKACWVPAGDCSVAMEGVCFRYGARDHALEGVDLEIRDGETVGLVGGSGAGKSTLALVLCRFYDPVAGRITIGGRDVRTIPIPELRRQFSLVFQDTFLFSASIRNNIAYGRPGATLEEIQEAATVARIHDFIVSLPEGYETAVGERGVTLSGGQRQRLAIARALIRRPRFLILDDCTSALDAQTEKGIQDGLGALGRQVSTLIIAHRYSSLANADRVYVLENGRVVESGAPAELNRPGTAFSRILQTRPGRDEASRAETAEGGGAHADGEGAP